MDHELKLLNSCFELKFSTPKLFSQMLIIAMETRLTYWILQMFLNQDFMILMKSMCYDKKRRVNLSADSENYGSTVAETVKQTHPSAQRLASMLVYKLNDTYLTSCYLFFEWLITTFIAILNWKSEPRLTFLVNKVWLISNYMFLPQSSKIKLIYRNLLWLTYLI